MMNIKASLATIHSHLFKEIIDVVVLGCGRVKSFQNDALEYKR